jgi:SnoaL-like domain
MAAVSSRTLGELADRHEIAEIRARYCRGIDRCDVELLRSVFWDDAAVHYGIFDGPAREFADLTVQTVRDSCQATMHLIANASLQLQDPEARGETYVLAYHSMSSVENIGELLEDPGLAAFKHELTGNKAPCSFVVGGRYLDIFARRGREWRIQERSYVWDWCDLGPPNLLFRAMNTATRLQVGRRDVNDRSYALLNAATS